MVYSSGPACNAFSNLCAPLSIEVCVQLPSPLPGSYHRGPCKLAVLPQKMTRSTPWMACPPLGWVGTTPARQIGSSPPYQTLHQSPRVC